jgi:molybdenum-dependent DNA-binding transcriptional regulator ModE
VTFDGRLFSGITVLAAVAESGSFVRAADALGLSASGVSRAVSRLEKRVGVRLLDRTTRSQTLTDEGRRLYEAVLPHLTGIEDAASEASGAANVVQGRLRVNVDPFLSRMVLASRLPAFLRRFPDLEVELIMRDDVGDIGAIWSSAGRYTRSTKTRGYAHIDRSVARLHRAMWTSRVPSRNRRSPENTVLQPCSGEAVRMGVPSRQGDCPHSRPGATACLRCRHDAWCLHRRRGFRAGHVDRSSEAHG